MKNAAAWGIVTLALCAQSDKALGAAAAAFTLETTVPAGFEDLTAPEQLVADLYFGGRAIGRAQITVDTRTVRFSDPSAVAAMLPETLAPEMVRGELANPLPRNSHKVCQLRSQQNCGYLVPESVALIYDDSRFRVDLFIAPTLLPRQAAIDSPFLPDSSSGFSFVQTLSGTWSGVESNIGASANSASLFGSSIVSFGESGLHSQWSATQSGDTFIHQMHWSRDYRGKAYALGLLQPESYFSGFIPSPYIYGVEYRSSNNSRVDNIYRDGTPLEVSMPTRGRIEIRREGRLLSSAMLEAGNQLVDTSNLPGGAYEIEVLTFDEGGRPLNRFTQLFAKDGLLPPSGEWSWELLAGKPAIDTGTTTLPSEADTYYVKGSLARRVSDNAGVIATAASTDSEQVMEIGSRWVQERFELSPSVIYSSNGGKGYRLTAQVTTPYFDLGVSETRITDTPDQLDSLAAYPILYRSTFNRSASLSSAVFGGRASIRHSESDRLPVQRVPGALIEDQFGSTSQLTTLEFQRGLMRTQSWYGDIRLSHSVADGDQQLTSISVQFRYRGDRWSGSSSVRHDRDHTGASFTRTGIATSWSDRDLWPLDVSQQISLEAASDNHYLSSLTRVAGRRGYLSSTISYRDNNDTNLNTTNYLGSFSTSLLSTGETFSWGGERAQNSAVIVGIDGSQDQNFEILVDGARRGYAKGGTQSVISLPSFRTYELALRPLEGGFYEYREPRQAVTLYPGNVATTDYQIETVILVLGRLMNGDNPVKDTKISIGKFSAVTDEYGVFQLTMYGKPKTLHVPPVQWGNCEVTIPEQTADKDWINIGIVDLAKAHCPSQGDQYVGN